MPRKVSCITTMFSAYTLHHFTQVNNVKPNSIAIGALEKKHVVPDKMRNPLPLMTVMPRSDFRSLRRLHPCQPHDPQCIALALFRARITHLYLEKSRTRTCTPPVEQYTLKAHTFLPATLQTPTQLHTPLRHSFSSRERIF
jgi:hypothetical protein